MNKPAAAKARWSETPHWYLWDGGFLLVGRANAIVPPHQHHALQIVFAIDGEVGIKGKSGEWRMCRGAIVRQDVVHSFNANGALEAMLFVDPESAEGTCLRSVLRQDITIVPEARLAAPIAALRQFVDQPLAGMSVPDLIKHCVQSLCTDAPSTRRLDERVTRVLDAIRGSDELRMSIDDAAAMAFLSPSRFAHLFKAQVGLPFRRYILWRKLTRAMLMIGRNQTISTAAHEADFADAAHLTRTFYQMVGLPPSVLMQGEFFEIPAPFAASPAPAAGGLTSSPTSSSRRS